MTVLARADDHAPDNDALALVESPLETFQLLDIHSGGYITLADRIDAIATISAGRKNPDTGLPQASRNGTIYLSDPDHRAPALRAALDAAHRARCDDDGRIRKDADGHFEPMRLTVAFPFDDPNLFIQQRYALYTASALKVYGDAHELHEIVTRERDNDKRTLELVDHLIHPAMLDGKPNPRFKELVRQCKCSWSIYFALARWDGLQAVVPFDDGFPNFYRLRTTSPKSLENIIGTLRQAARTQALGGHIAGLPFELRITYPEQPDQTGTKRHAPVWVITAKPPHGVVLRGSNLEKIFGPAIAEGRALQPGGARALSAPSAETWGAALTEAAQGQVIVDDDAGEDIDVLLTGDPPADRQRWGFRWIKRVEGTALDSNEARAKFLHDFSDGRTSSLSEFLRTARVSECEQLMLAVDRYLAMLDAEANARGVDGATGEIVDERAHRAAAYRRIYEIDTSQGIANASAPTPVVVSGAVEGQESVGSASPPTDSSPDYDAMLAEYEAQADADTDAPIDPGDMGEAGWTSDAPMPSSAQVERATNMWLLDLSRRFREHPGWADQHVAERKQQVALGRYLMTAADNDTDVATRLLQQLTGRTELSATTVAHVDVLLADAAVPGWGLRMDALKQALGVVG